MRGKTVWLIAGAHLVDYVAETARQLVETAHVARVVLLAASADDAGVLAAPLDGLAGIETLVVGDAIEAGMDEAMRRWGRPIAVVCAPMAELPTTLFDADRPLSAEGFTAAVEANLTWHFRVTRKAALYDDCQLILVTPDVPTGGAPAAFALANFFKTTLHAFTATVAVESERLVHDVAVNQINLTRRVRSEEPRDLDEHLEETRRFARAVMLLGAPLPDAEDSRYRARIYRGMSMTV
jgi:malonyl-CoA reductase/3-hydroxypropionate dehydrogenase (NADP+)